MKKRGMALRLTLDGQRAGLALVTASFGIGALAGLFALLQVPRQELYETLYPYVQASAGGALAPPSLWLALWRNLRWPLAVFFMGYTALGVVGVPVTMALRGFLLSFSVSAFLGALGPGGLLWTFWAFGLTALVGLPPLLLLGSWSCDRAGSLLRNPRRSGEGERPSFPWLYPLGGAVASALLECWVLGPLLAAAAS